MNKYTESESDVVSKLPDQDLRINHILIYLNANGTSNELKKLALLDIFRIQIFPENDVRLKILQTLAHIKYNEYVLASFGTIGTSSSASSNLDPNLIKIYEKYLNDYRDYRSIIAAFINATSFLESQRFEEAAPFYCVACEYNERITSYLKDKMKGMDHEFLLANRRKCLKMWNQSAIKKFTFRTTRTTDLDTLNLNLSQTSTQVQQLTQQELVNLIETMINKFLPCFFRLATSTSEDKAMLAELRQNWLDSLESNLTGFKINGRIWGRKKIKNIFSKGVEIFQEFMEKIWEEPTVNHFHSLNVNKTNLSNRYKEMVQTVKKI